VVGDGIVAVAFGSIIQQRGDIASRNRYEFMLTVNPLALPNATGSPVNPIAMF